MKIGDRVRIVDPQDYRQQLINLEGVIVNIDYEDDYPIYVDLGRVIPTVTSSLDGTLTEKTGFNLKKDELLVVGSNPIVNKVEDFKIGDSIIVNHNYYIEELRGLIGTVVVISNSDDIGVCFGHERLSFHTLDGLLNRSTGRYFGSNEIQHYSNKTIKKEENMNEEIERALREGNMAIALSNQEKAFKKYEEKMYFSKSPTPSKGKEDTTIHQIKKRFRKVGYIAHRLTI